MLSIRKTVILPLAFSVFYVVGAPAQHGTVSLRELEQVKELLVAAKGGFFPGKHYKGNVTFGDRMALILVQLLGEDGIRADENVSAYLRLRNFI